jgi:hypothetical protein
VGDACRRRPVRGGWTRLLVVVYTWRGDEVRVISREASHSGQAAAIRRGLSRPAGRSLEPPRAQARGEPHDGDHVRARVHGADPRPVPDRATDPGGAVGARDGRGRGLVGGESRRERTSLWCRDRRFARKVRGQRDRRALPRIASPTARSTAVPGSGTTTPWIRTVPEARATYPFRVWETQFSPNSSHSSNTYASSLTE